MATIHRLAVATALAVAGTVGLAGTAHAGPPVPPGCTFDKGVLTCVSTTSSATTYPAYTTPDSPVATEIVPGYTGADICRTFGLGDNWGSMFYTVDLVLTKTTTVTTTSQRHGLNGSSIGSTSTSTSKFDITSYSQYGCSI